MSTWLDKFLNKFKKEALDKLPDEELAGTIPGLNSEAPPADPSAGAAPPPAPTEDPSMMAPPEEPEPDVTGNQFEVDVNGVKVKLRLMPELIMKEPTPPPAAPGAAPADPMADKSLNPNADPEELAKWMTDQSNEKPVGNQDQGTVEPLSQEDEGISDVGNENELGQDEDPNDPKVQVHKKPKKQAAAEEVPGADRSNPYYPCGVCANYDAANGTCVQGIDTEKAQAAKSCSWLNSNFTTFLGDGPNSEQTGKKDEETYKNDVSQVSGNGDNGQRAASLKNIWKKI